MTDIQAQAGTPDPIDDAMRYLLNGGLFNPEAMNHAQVRDLVMRLRDEVISSRKTTDLERAAAERCATERDYWKANHDNAVAIKQAVLDRPDLQDRARRVQQLVQERDEATALLRQASYDIQLHIADKQKAEAQLERIKRPLLSFIETIDATGGVYANLAPVADEDWQDLGEAYAEACSALGVTMKQTKEDA